MTDRELARRSGLSVTTIALMSREKTWNRFAVATVDAFARACGVDLIHPRRQLDYLKRRKLAHAERNDRAKKLFAMVLAAANHDKVGSGVAGVDLAG